jgi:hypothetical protein
MHRALSLVVLFALFALAADSSAAHADDDLLHVTSDITYDLRPDTGPVTVTWDVSLRNNDPETRPRDGRSYQSVTLPVLSGASSVSAVSGDGDALATSVDGDNDGVLTGAVVQFAEPVYYRGTYNFRLSYQLAEVREASVLATPNYLYLPIIAAGDQATITVNTPTDTAWPSTLEPGPDCEQEGNIFRCSGSDLSYLAATAEVSHPSAMTTSSFNVPLRETSLAVNVTFFQGEDAFAQHLQALATAALPLIEAEYGFSYRGAPALTFAQGGRQSILGYEGLTSCDASGCHVTVSPGADDVTLIHELAHLWSGIYSERWLAEGFAQLIAEDVAAQLPDLVRRLPAPRAPSSVPLSLDDWGDVGTVIGATEAERALESSGYDLSLRFLYQLRFEAGAEALRAVNAAIAAGGSPVNSRAYLDAFENTTGRSVDGLFGEWVFGPAYDTILTQRREARAAVADLDRRLAEAGLSPTITAPIKEHIAAWRFRDALSELESAQDGFATYEALIAEIDAFRLEAGNAGLIAPEIAAEDLAAWKFSEARLEIERARQALAAYISAGETLSRDRSVLDRFGLLGKDPEGTLESAAAAFTSGEFERSRTLSNDAASMVRGADNLAMRRFAIVFGVAGLFAIVVLGAVWISRHREHEFA